MLYCIEILMILCSTYCMGCLISLHALQMHTIVVLMNDLLFLGSGSRVYGSASLGDSGIGASDTGLSGTRLFTGQ